MVKLGEEVKDKVTGFKGIAISSTTYLQGCNRIVVQPKVNKEGVIPDSISFDEPDLEVIGDGINSKAPTTPKKHNGGPRLIATPRGQAL